jgi:hypothetical protein
MDPDAEWNDLRSAISANDLAAAREHAAALVIWLDGGGFQLHIDSAELDDEAVTARWNQMTTRRYQPEPPVDRNSQ